MRQHRLAVAVWPVFSEPQCDAEDMIMSKYWMKEVKEEGGQIVRWEIYHEDELIRSFTDQHAAEKLLSELRDKEEKNPTL